MKNLTYYVETQLNVFDTYVKSVISFYAEIWELHKGQDGRKSAYTFLRLLDKFVYVLYAMQVTVKAN